MDLIVGVWAVGRAKQAARPSGSLFWLYVISQLFFLGFFGGVLTLKMAVLLEQTLMLVFVVLLVRKPAA
jgi:hypothetical protein